MKVFWKKPKHQIELNDENEFEKVCEEINNVVKLKKNIKITVEKFEKDNDSNLHIDFITATSNLRAANYSIKPADRLETKKIAGKITPAIATATASVAGLVILELIKLVANVKFDCFKNGFMNLALPLFSFAEPIRCQTQKIGTNLEITLWDKWEVKLGPNCTIKDFLAYVKQKWKLTVTGILQGKVMVYIEFYPDHDKRLPKKMSNFVKFEEGKVYADLVITFEDAEGNEVEGPPIRFWKTGAMKRRRKKKSTT